MAGNNDAGDFELRITSDDAELGEFVVEEFTGLEWDPQRDASFNEGPQGVAFGFNFQRSSNRVSMSFTVRETSKDLWKVYKASETQEPVKVVVRLVKNFGSYDADQIVELGAEKCVIMPGSTSRGGGDAGDVSFTALGINPIKKRKSEAITS